jgi:hypothetical protein
MRSIKFLVLTGAASLLLAGVVAQAAQVTGTVTNKTTGKPAVGDTVVLVDVQAGMGEAAKATTDAHGHYSLTKPGNSPYLVRAMHQGAGYFIAAPEGGAPGDISVYDVAAKVEGVAIDEDVLGMEAANGQLQITERYILHNNGTPPRTQWSPHSFEVALPTDATVAGVAVQRPGGLPTSVKLDPDGPKGHYSFNLPIQPDEGDKGTLFQIEYSVPYGSGKYTFKPQVTLPARTVWVVLPKSMTFAGAGFQSSPQDPGVQTYVAKNAVPGKALEFTVGGSGSMPREAQGGGGQQGADSGGQDASATGNGPGGGIGAPIGGQGPIPTKYMWWILGALALMMAAAAAFLLRKPAGTAAVAGAPVNQGVDTAASFAPTTSKNTALLSVLKDEMFALESEKIAGTLTPDEYAEAKSALETVLKRALKRS